jgi:hypothetical protein
MSWGAYAILVIFGAFVVLLIINPNLSCFGKRVRSPFYPLKRKRDLKKKTTDYKFDLGGGGPKKTEPSGKTVPDKKTEDYGFRLD